MTAPIRRVALACLVLFGILLVNVNYLQVVQAKSLRNNPSNGRQLIDRYRRERGPILIGTTQIARSVATSDRLKYLRTYPKGPEYAPITGYYSLFGSTDVEHARDEVLSGDDPTLVIDRLTTLLTGRVTQGGSVTLTINPAAQDAAWKLLGGRRGAVVALDPRTGAVLALVSSPSYDPGPFASHDGGIVAAYSDKLAKDKAQPLTDRAVERRYPPGSLFKVVTAAAALSSGRFQPDTRIPSPHELPLPQTHITLGNFGGETCGDGTTDTLADALRISCNTAFAGLGLALTQGPLRAQAQAFGIGAGLPDWPLPYAHSVFPDKLNLPQTAQSAIGQYDVALTPMQAALIAAAVANHGREMAPYVIAHSNAPDLSQLDATQPQELGTPISAKVADQLTAMMEDVVNHGTGMAAQIAGVRVAGKTGTAQHAVGKPPHTWFIGFAPADNPQVAVAVLVEDGGNAGSEATGGAVAAPIARAVMAAVLGKS